MSHRPRKAKSIRIRTKGPLHGQCNICGQIGPLTDDHTPPKSCLGVTAAELHSLHDKLSSEGERWSAPRRFQAGVFYRSLCERCNGLLGTKHDPALAEMVAQVRSIVGSSLKLPGMITLDIAPCAVMRSVIGHLSAQGVERYGKGSVLTDAIRDYIYDEARPLPPTLRMYYWLYPFRLQVLVRDAALLKISRDAVFAFWLMKFFPLAFFITIDEPPGPIYRLQNFDAARHLSANDRQRIYLPIRPLISPGFPERPDDDGAILYGQQAMVAEQQGS
jgi:hypothetical protein